MPKKKKVEKPVTQSETVQPVDQEQVTTACNRCAHQQHS